MKENAPRLSSEDIGVSYIVDILFGDVGMGLVKDLSLESRRALP